MQHKIATPFPIHRKHHGGDADTGANSTHLQEINNFENGGESNSKESVHSKEFSHRPATPYEDKERGDEVVAEGDVFGGIRIIGETSKISEDEKLDGKSADAQEELDGIRIKYLIDVNNTTTGGQKWEAHDDEWSNTSTFDSQSHSSDLNDLEDSEGEHLQEEKLCELSKTFRNVLESEESLMFELEDSLEELEPYSSNASDKYNNNNEMIARPTLSTVQIVAPKSFESQMDLTFPSESDNDYFAGPRQEKRIRDKVRFLLNKTNSSALKNFTFTNEGDGSDLCNGISRLQFWRKHLQRFLRRNSSSLEKITIRTVMKNFDSFKIAEKEYGLGKFYTFPNLTELELIFWNTSANENLKQGHEANLEKNYWVKLLRTRAAIGTLKRLVWMSSTPLSFTDIWEPILHHNGHTLQTVHILNNDNHSIQKMQEEKVYFSISCASFSAMTQLQSLYLQDSQCFAHHLALLPTNLIELSLDGLCLESCEIKMAVKKLTNLKNLRLVNNNLPLKDDNALESPMFGVNLDVISVILQHRKLENLFIWGYTFSQPTKNYCQLTPTESQTQRKSRSRFQRLINFCTSVKSRITKSKADVKIESIRNSASIIVSEKQCCTIINALSEIAKVDKFSISIQSQEDELAVGPSSSDDNSEVTAKYFL